MDTGVTYCTANVTLDEGRADRLRAAEAIERLGMRRRYRDELARHRLAALPLGDPAAAIGATLDAARAALHRFDPAAAVGHCTAALDAVAPYGETARVWRAELLTVLGTAQAAAGDRTGANQTLTDAVDLADLADAPGRQIGGGVAHAARRAIRARQLRSRRG
jgi:hypothetical protein